tara:strand:- start:1083 stop:1343 length:261 start_codon:yes stop_codon:yes gene_type:complete
MNLIQESKRLEELGNMSTISVDFWQDKVMSQIGLCESLESTDKVGSVEHQEAIEELHYLLGKLSFEDTVLKDLEARRLTLLKKKND